MVDELILIIGEYVPIIDEIIIDDVIFKYYKDRSIIEL
jgi:hypothetical protein